MKKKEIFNQGLVEISFKTSDLCWALNEMVN